jgi:hypothetical protein
MNTTSSHLDVQSKIVDLIGTECGMIVTRSWKEEWTEKEEAFVKMYKFSS